MKTVAVVIVACFMCMLAVIFIDSHEILARAGILADVRQFRKSNREARAQDISWIVHKYILVGMQKTAALWYLADNEFGLSFSPDAKGGFDIFAKHDVDGGKIMRIFLVYKQEIQILIDLEMILWPGSTET